MNKEQHSLHAQIMEAIKKGDIRMRPRWHFVLLTTLGAIGALILLLTLVYTWSILVFLLRESGAWALPSFGGRGWVDMLRSLPVSIVLLMVAFMVVLEVLARRFAFVYKKPLIFSAAGIILIVFAGGYLLAQTPLHAQLALSAHDDRLPPPLAFLYRPPFRLHPDDVYRGRIASLTDRAFLLVERGGGTTTVIITPRTRLPLGGDFSEGETVVVIGDRAASGTVEAFGIRDVEDVLKDAR